MSRLLLLPLALLALTFAYLTTTVQAGRLACGVCEALVDEVNAGILATTKTHAVQTRFRIDEKKKVSYARTEHNLLEIMESDDFPRKFEKYGIVKPFTKTAKFMKRAYELVAEGKSHEIEPIPQETKERTAPAAEAATTADPQLATPTDATPPESAASDAADAPAKEKIATYDPFLPTSGAVPFSLQNHHVHLASHSLKTAHGLLIESSKAIEKEIKNEVSSLLEEYLDEAMLMFHRDVPDLKQKLCMEITEACQPKKRKEKAKTEPATAADSATPAAEAEAAKKDEL